MKTKQGYSSVDFIPFRSFKNIPCIIIATTIFYLCININSFSFAGQLSGIGETWTRILAPFTSFIGDTEPVRVEIVPNYKNTYWVNVPRIYTQTQQLFFQRESFYNNGFIRLLTFWNKDVIRSLSTATTLGDTSIPYHIFLHGSNNSIYMAKELTAPGVLLYGYSWIINIPEKFLNTLDSFINLSDIGILTGRDKLMMTLDLLWSFILTIFIELPLAIINTVIGFFIALIFHPINSILAIPGCIYYAILATLNAIWGIVSNIIMIPVHVIF